MMSNNQLRSALRFLARHKGYSGTNILGLTLGLCACLVIYNPLPILRKTYGRSSLPVTFFLSIFPALVLGSSSTNRYSFGMAKDFNFPLSTNCRRYWFSLSAVIVSFVFDTITAIGRSIHFSSGIATTATSDMPG